MFPMKPSGARVVSAGTMSADNNIVVASKYGVKRKIHEVFSETTTSFKSNFRRSA